MHRRHSRIKAPRLSESSGPVCRRRNRDYRNEKKSNRQHACACRHSITSNHPGNKREKGCRDCENWVYPVITGIISTGVCMVVAGDYWVILGHE